MPLFLKMYQKKNTADDRWNASEECTYASPTWRVRLEIQGGSPNVKSWSDRLVSSWHHQHWQHWVSCNAMQHWHCWRVVRVGWSRSQQSEIRKEAMRLGLFVCNAMRGVTATCMMYLSRAVPTAGGDSRSR